MTAGVSSEGVRGILLDIEGTTTPIAFVHDVLFSYARQHVTDFLTKHRDSDDVQADIRLLREEHAADISQGNQPPLLENDEIAAYVDWLIDLDRKSTGLKSLQGKIWREGYVDGSLQAQVYPDVAPALARWRTAGLSVSIFSSGSVLAQQLLFAHTEAGDLTQFIDQYFDTSAGKKGEARSYRHIAERLGLKPNEVLFISDVTTELAAAREAGMKTLLSIRPGNEPQPSADQYEIIETFDDLLTSTRPEA
jgi:enolase-phosphatase E1